MSDDITTAKEVISQISNAAGNYYSHDVRQSLSAIDPDLASRADQALHVANAKISNTLKEAEYTASNVKMYPEGRQAEVVEMSQQLGKDVDEALNSAELVATIAQAHLDIAAMPKFDDGDKQSAIANLSAILTATPAERRKELLSNLASRDGSVSAALFTNEGRTLAVDALGIDPAMYESLRSVAVNAAAESSNEQRRQAAAARQNLAGLSNAVAGYRSAVYQAQAALSSLGKVAGRDSRDMEIARLRRIAGIREGQAQ